MEIIDTVFFILIGLMGLVFHLFGIAGMIHFYRRLKRSSERTLARVDQLQSEIDDDGETFRANIAFQHEGKHFKMRDEIRSKPPEFRVGDHVAVYFPPGRPDLAQVGKWRYFSTATIIAIGGLAFFILALFLLNQ